MPDDADREERLFRRLTDPANPRTPLHFKLLDRQVAAQPAFLTATVSCAFHRTEGYIAGVAAAPQKPLSKMFADDDE